MVHLDAATVALVLSLVLLAAVVALGLLVVARLQQVEQEVRRLRTDLDSRLWLLFFKTAPRDLDARDLQVVYDVDFLGRRPEDLAREKERPVDEVYRRYDRGRERLDRWTTPPKA